MATFSLSDTSRRAQATGNGSAGPFSFSFQVNSQSDLKVYVDTTLKTLTTHYTVTVGASGTGSVSFTAGNHPTSSQTVTILSDVPVSRTSVYTAGGNITASALESDFDTQTMMLGDREERESRTVMAPVDDPTSADMTLPGKDTRKGKVLGFNATTGNPEAGPEIADVSTLAAITADISTLADIEDGTDATDAIQTVAGISSNVTTVVGNTTNINTVAANDANITAVGGISSNVTTVAGISGDVTAVANDATDIGVVGSNISAVTTAASNISAIQNASANAATATTKASEASSSAGAALVSQNAAAASQTAAAASETAAGTSETNAATSATAASNSASAAATSASNAATSESNASTSQGAAATSATNAATSAATATTKAGEASTSATNAATSATNAATSATAASSSATAAANSAAAAAAAFDNFDDTYLGSFTADPTVDNDGDALVEGALYFNTTANEMRVYDGANWIAASSAGTASLLEYKYTATAGQTTFSGTDDNSATLSYSTANLILTLNGIVLENGTDYTATSGTSIVLTVGGAAAGDELNVIAFKSFTAADMVSATTGGTFNGNVTVNGTLAATTFSGVTTVPVGGIIMFSGTISSLDAAWAICDGTNGTPNLTDTFVMGTATQSEIGDTGGSADAIVVNHTHTASTNSAGSHNHTGSTSSAGNHRHSITSGSGTSSGGRAADTSNTGATIYTNYAGAHTHSFTTNSTGSHSHTVTVNGAGSSGTNANLPPYYKLAYIMRVS